MGIRNHRGLARVARALALVLATLCLSVVEARAQRLTIQGDKFAIDGQPKFLTFMSFFGVMGWPNIADDLRYLKRLGFDGIRIWPNLDTGPQLMNGDGSLRPEELAHLRFIIEEARRLRLVVDVTFTYEHIRGMTPATARTGIMNATDALRSYDHILFDIQNERNVGDRRFMSVDDVRRIAQGIRSVDSTRIVVCSNSPVHPPEYAARFTADLGLDATAYHEPRDSNWYQLAVVRRVVDAMKANGKPAYLQEPMSTRDDLYHYPSHEHAEYFMQAYANAKLAGAAAWTFHTDAGVEFRPGGPRSIEEMLRSNPEPEWAFVNSIIPKVALQASNGSNYVVAEGGGGSTVRANAVSAGPWETFGIVSLTGGPVLSGERVVFTTANGTHYLQASAGGGAALRAAGEAVGPWETFLIEKAGGGIIRSGDLVTLRANDSPFFVTAESGGGGNVMVNAAAAASWETFRIVFLSPHSNAVGTSRK